MMRVLFLTLAAVVLAGVSGAADGGAGGSGNSIPFRVIPFEQLGVTAKNWGDESRPRYSIIASPAEWQMAFEPAPGRKTHSPNAAFFGREHLVAVSRVSEAPMPGERVLVVKSLQLVEGELVLEYSFIPPARNTGHRVKNTVVLAIPSHYQYNIRFSEEIETPLTLKTERELEEAKAAGRFKPHAPQR